MPIAEELGIAGLLEKYPYEVSGGQKQRAAAARALITEPRLLLADEPTGALDSKSTDEMLGIFSRINQKGQTIVMVTHNMQQAVRVSDQTAFFLLGDLVEYGDTDQLFSTPKEKKTEDYITGRFG